MVDQGAWRKRLAYHTIIHGSGDQTERKKAIISNSVYNILVWHIWTVISVSVSITLVCLNLMEYSIGGELGGSPGGTANIIGALQLAIKAHEIMIVASLYMITRQWIQRSLLDLDNGIPLGLLGAEIELGQPSFLISKGYLVTFSLWRRKQGRLDICLLTVFLFVATILSSLAGPASGVLMIPRPDWFVDSEFSILDDTLYRYPYLLVRPKFEDPFDKNNTIRRKDPFSPSWLPDTKIALEYWEGVSRGYALPVHQRESTYDVAFGTGSRLMNISTTPGRSIGNNQTSRTYAKTILHFDVDRLLYMMNRKDISDKHAQAMLHWSGRRYAVKGNAMTVEANCDHPSDDQCQITGAFTGNQTTKSCPQGLVLLSSMVEGLREFDYLERVYMTEGPRIEKYPEFTNSYQLIFDRRLVLRENGAVILSKEIFPTTTHPLERVIICSVITTIQPAVLYSLATRFSPEHADYLSPENRTILFHERWLDGTNRLRERPFENPSATGDQTFLPRNMSEPTGNQTFSLRNMSEPTSNQTFSPRNMSEHTGNPHLSQFGNVLNRAQGHIGTELDNNSFSKLETIVSGTFLAVFSNLEPSDSQYTYNSHKTLPQSMMPEPPVYPPERHVIITPSNRGYGFRLSSRTGILGMTILITHAVIVVLGSLWQLFWRRSVITAWETIPDYIALGSGSVIPPADVLNNTCAGIAATKSLQKIVRVGETTHQHLEIAVEEPGPWSIMKSVLGKHEVKYGALGGGGKEKLE